MSIVLLHQTWFPLLPDLYRSSLTKVWGFWYTWPSYHCWEYFIHQSSWASTSSTWNCWSTRKFYSIMQRFSGDSTWLKCLYCRYILLVYGILEYPYTRLKPEAYYLIYTHFTTYHHPTTILDVLSLTNCPWYTSSNRIVPIPVVSFLWTTMYCISNVIYLQSLCKALMMSYY
jgi:hypothetical protein